MNNSLAQADEPVVHRAPTQPKRGKLSLGRIVLAFIIAALGGWGAWALADSYRQPKPIFSLVFPDDGQERDCIQCGPYLINKRRKHIVDHLMEVEVRSIQDGSMLATWELPYDPWNAVLSTGLQIVPESELGKDACLWFTQEAGKRGIQPLLWQPMTNQTKLLNRMNGYLMSDFAPNGKYGLGYTYIPCAYTSLLGCTGLPDVLNTVFQVRLAGDYPRRSITGFHHFAVVSLTSSEKKTQVFCIPETLGQQLSFLFCHDGNQILITLYGPPIAIVQSFSHCLYQLCSWINESPKLFRIHVNANNLEPLNFQSSQQFSQFSEISQNREFFLVQGIENSELSLYASLLGNTQEGNRWLYLATQQRLIPLGRAGFTSFPVRSPHLEAVRLAGVESHDHGPVLRWIDLDNEGNRSTEHQLTLKPNDRLNSVIPRSDQFIITSFPPWSGLQKWLYEKTENLKWLRRLPSFRTQGTRIIDARENVTLIERKVGARDQSQFTVIEDQNRLLIRDWYDSRLLDVAVYPLPLPVPSPFLRWLPLFTGPAASLVILILAFMLARRRRRANQT